jgi:aminoglycoside phosphotransferase (APT) family kinase protein
VNGTYVGYVADHDWLHGYLKRIVRERMGVREDNPAFRVFRLKGSNEVYAYEEKHSGAKVICKFYGPKFGWDRDKAESAASQEYQALRTLRGYGLVGSPHHVIRPFGVNRDLNCVLALEYYGGEQLSHAIARAIRGDEEHLHWRLRALASFLATLHRRTANGRSVNFDSDCRYLDTLVDRLQSDRLGQWEDEEFAWLRDRWRDRPQMWNDQQVWLHGDATPANFLFGDGMDVAAIDLERMKRGDRMFDVGRIAGELQHAFMIGTGDKYRAEPFIGHFLREYCRHLPDPDAAFVSVTGRAPYYMGMNLLRIARNDYVSEDYSAQLIEQAKILLRAF